MFFRKYKDLRNWLQEVQLLSGAVNENPYIHGMMFFSHLFYKHGFIAVGQPPAFGNAYKNISKEVFEKTYIALPIYFCYRCGLTNTSFESTDDVTTTLLSLYPSLDDETARYLVSTWSGAEIQDRS